MTDTCIRCAPEGALHRAISAFASTAVPLSLAPFTLSYPILFSGWFAALAIGLSMLLGIGALRRIKEHGRSDERLATPGLMVSGALIAFIAFLTTIYAVILLAALWA